MNLNEVLIPELRIEAATTRTVLQRVPQNSLSWRPHERSRTLGEIAAHIANLPGLFIAHLNEEGFDHDTYTAPTDTVQQIVDTFDRNVAAGQAVLASLTNARLLEPWEYRYGERVIFTMPRLVVVRTTALNHLVHHRGQLSLYLRLLNIPVPAIYGPTADEA